MRTQTRDVHRQWKFEAHVARRVRRDGDELNRDDVENFMRHKASPSVNCIYVAAIVFLWAALIAILCFGASGCKTPEKLLAPVGQPEALKSTSATAKTEVYVDNIKRSVEAIQKNAYAPDVEPAGRILVDVGFIQEQLSETKKANEAQNKQLLEADFEIIELRGERDNLKEDIDSLKVTSKEDIKAAVAAVKGSPAYIIGSWIVWGFSFILIAVGLIIVLRVVGVLNHGWIGTAASMFGVFLAGILTCGVSWIGEFCSNLHFRSNWEPKAA
jgi:hypothetical protein